MSLIYNTDIGYGIRVKEHEAEENHPAGFVVEVHFYDKHKAGEYADAAKEGEPEKS